MNLKLFITKWIPDKIYLQLLYFKHFRRFINFKSPKTFNEKLQWLKLNDRNPRYTQMVDKYEAKKYVAEKIGEEYIIPTIGVWEKIEEIDFGALPKQFVLKWNHDSGSVVICKDKNELKQEEIIKKLSRGKIFSGYWYGREWPYKNVCPRIMAEKYMDDNGEELVDYKIHNFNGEPKFILVCRDRFKESGLTEDFYSTEWEHLDVKRPGHPNAKKEIDCPAELEEMLELSKVLSKDIPFVRTDFYTINHKVYFGELTFYPASGFSAFEPNKYDELLGEWLQLPIREKSV